MFSVVVSFVFQAVSCVCELCLLRTAASLMDDVLKDGTEARKLAVELKNVQYSEQLVQQLFKHSEQMETLYGSFQELMGCSETKEKKFRKAIDLANDKMKWFAKSKEGASKTGSIGYMGFL